MYAREVSDFSLPLHGGIDSAVVRDRNFQRGRRRDDLSSSISPEEIDDGYIGAVARAATTRYRRIVILLLTFSLTLDKSAAKL